uniref:EGF-like module-containing mucin-like hormone receptor-like 1 n=1 Tax=Stegastes partitus TaxID=144197 RepID=A0A3B5AXS7_9TELE
MMGRWNLLILALFLSLTMVSSESECQNGYSFEDEHCKDIDECAVDEDYPESDGDCGENTLCFNTIGSFYCRCADGFSSSPHAENFAADSSATCKDRDECDDKNICGQNAACVNTQGSYHCVCNAGFRLKSGNTIFSGNQEQCEDICQIDKTICGNGTCHLGASGHYCACHAGFTNYGNKKSRCSALSCDVFQDTNNLKEIIPVSHDVVRQLNKSCLDLTESESPEELDGMDMLRRLLSVMDEVLSKGALNDNRKVSTFLDLVEEALRLIGPFINSPWTYILSNHTELQHLLHTGSVIPQGTKTFSSEQAQLDIQLEIAAGEPSYYPGFTTVSLLSYSNLENSTDGFFGGMKPEKDQSFKVNSKVVTVIVSNSNTSHLKEDIKLTLYHLTQSNQTSHTCVFWDSSKEGGAWSAHGCKALESNAKYTVCSCNHLSSFAVLMSLSEMEDRFELKLITWLGLSLSLICLLICILTFSMIRSIQSPRTTIHLHLCISLFIANVIFLAGISQTENRVGCAVVAGMLHFFYLAAFCWMCLEGIQLFRMVVLVFNTSFKTLYMMAGGYGVPAVIVAVSALANAEGYGTKRYCWLKLDLIWSFFGPVCVIISVNIFFFLVTVWKLAQKFSSLNPDLDKLQKIKAFTITAVAQLCVLGTMWIFGCFQFEEGTVVMSYLFTILGSLQGVMIFVMHCLFSKQVREEYGNILSRFCAPQKKSYSEFSSSHSSKAHASKSTEHTGESHI